MIFFHRYVVKKYFLNNLFFDCFPEKYAFKTGGSFAIKKYGYSVVKQSVRNVCKVWSQLFQPFLYWGSSSIYHSESSENITFLFFLFHFCIEMK